MRHVFFLLIASLFAILITGTIYILVTDDEYRYSLFTTTDIPVVD